MQMQLILGKDRRTALEAALKLPAVGAMAMLLPGALWNKHGLRHPLGESFEGFADFVPEEVTSEQIAEARRLATPELLGDGVVAGSVDEVIAEIRPWVDAGLRHLVIWNIGPLVTGASGADIMRLGVLIRRLRKLSLVPRSAAVAA
jgi:phthiodiolone/phenolphthiodiolone dimycocerosates ketoreductase